MADYAAAVGQRSTIDILGPHGSVMTLSPVEASALAREMLGLAETIFLGAELRPGTQFAAFHLPTTGWSLARATMTRLPVLTVELPTGTTLPLALGAENTIAMGAALVKLGEATPPQGGRSH